MLRAVIKNAVIDLIGQDEQVVLAGDIDDLLQHFARVDRTRWVIRVNDHDGLGFIRNLGLDVLDGWIPIIVLITQVVHWGATCQGRSCGPQWIIRCRDENLIAVIEQRLGGHADELGDAIAQEDIVDIEGREVLQLVAGNDGSAGRNDSLGGGITLGSRQGSDHIAHDDIGCFEAKDGRVTGVEFQDGVAIELHAFRFRRDLAADVIRDALEFVGLVKDAVFGRSHGSIVPRFTATQNASTPAMTIFYSTR